MQVAAHLVFTVEHKDGILMEARVPQFVENRGYYSRGGSSQIIPDFSGEKSFAKKCDSSFFSRVKHFVISRTSTYCPENIALDSCSKNFQRGVFLTS